jgi:hypothetical protein
MPKGCQLGRDGSQAAALARLWRSTREAAGLDPGSLGNRLAALAAAGARAEKSNVGLLPSMRSAARLFLDDLDSSILAAARLVVVRRDGSNHAGAGRF